MSRHDPVLSRETIEWVTVGETPGGNYVDATFGRGGHSRRLLERIDPSSRLLALDRDLAAVEAAQQLAREDSRVIPRHGSFGNIAAILDEVGMSDVQGAIMDLGVSSPQLDNVERGFSFRSSGPLDMRMDQSQRLRADTWLNDASIEEIQQVLREYGEERHARRIAQAIVRARPLATTDELAQIVANAQPRGTPGKHDATRVFQAVRIFVNDELDELSEGLNGLFPRLARGGRLAVISFHSLEDRIVKRFFKSRSTPPRIPREVPIKNRDIKVPARIVTGPIRASDAEVARNPRSRSALLRVLERAA
ncbi:MAG: 16S rRNA (cytosine(1402)-N(4))-methyltransferase RsmH [Pseudomonadales bacterium]